MKYITLVLTLLLSIPAYAVDWIAHRGNSCGAPENTIQAVSDSWHIGADAVEIDVRFSSDGVVYLFHDNDFREKPVRDLAYHEIMALIGEDLVPSLTSILKLNPKGIYILDLKQPKVSDLPYLMKAMEGAGVSQERIFVQSSNVTVLKAAREVFTDSPLAFLTNLSRSWQIREALSAKEILSLVDGVEIDALTVKGRKFLDASYIQTLKSTGLKVFVWTINDPERAVYYESIGVDGIITDAIVGIRGLGHLCKDRASAD